jgi:hypothetical protein
MKQKQIAIFSSCLAAVITAGVLFSGCDKNNDIVIPPIGGYNNSDEVGAANLTGYWNMDGDGKESKSGATPTSSVGATYVSGGVKGQALSLTNGYLYYAANTAPLVTNQAFTVSAWVQVTNNGGVATGPANVPYSYFQSAIPGKLFGNITAIIEAGQYKSTSDTLVVKSIYQDQGGGTQDNINNYGNVADYKVVKKAGTSQWVHIVTTYNPTGGTGTQSIFRIYADSARVSNTGFENKGTNNFKYTPGEIIIGGWYNNIPGKTVSTDTWTVPFNGKIDEIRVWNKLLPESDIVALYQLGKAGR